MKKIILTALALVIITCSIASTIDTVSTYSPSMKKYIKAVVITPNSYDKQKKFPVVYLLHGYSDNYAQWPTIKNVLLAADLYNTIIVSADGGYSSWYWDSPVDSTFRYETYISKELVSWVDEHYTTIKSPKARAITGLSMGGHGALYLAFKHPDVFGAAGSMSGGVDIRPFPFNWDMAKRLGKYAQKPENWETHTVINLLHLVEPGALSIIIDCGTGDFFYDVNEELHRQMLLRNIKHDYITRPGVHNWEYWSNAIQYQLLFFYNFFQNTK